jgi:hypothetical protein
MIESPVVNFMKEPDFSSLRAYFTARPPVNHNSWHVNSLRSSVHPAIPDAVLGHRDKKEIIAEPLHDISDQDPVRAVDMMQR